jgi:type I restriction enzyme M protein
VTSSVIRHVVPPASFSQRMITSGSVTQKLSAAKREHLRKSAIRGVELVPEVARLATMNLLLHGISGDTDDELPITVADSLRMPPIDHIDVVLSNPPFGAKSSITYSTKDKACPAEF